MADDRSETAGSLAGAYTEGPGLPRGRNSLEPAEARAIQRDRLVRAALATIAELGYAQTTVREVARRARVSMRSFYEHFSDREDCLLGAVADAEAEIAARVGRELADLPADTEPVELLRAAFEANLGEWAKEPELAAVLHLELRAAGPAGRERYFAFIERFARFCRAWHRKAYPVVAAATPPEAYRMAMGAVEQLVTERVDAGRVEELGALSEPALRVTLATLSAWSGPGAQPSSARSAAGMPATTRS